MPKEARFIQHIFEDAYQKYGSKILRNILKYISDEEVASDLLQETYLSFWEQLCNNKNILSSESWLMVVSRNKTLTYLKSKNAQSYIPIDDTLLIERSQKEENQESLYNQKQKLLIEAVNNLPQRKREVFVLNQYEGVAIEDVAHLMNISTNSAHEYLRDAVRQLRKQISPSVDALDMLSCIFILSSFFS